MGKRIWNHIIRIPHPHTAVACCLLYAYSVSGKSWYGDMRRRDPEYITMIVPYKGISGKRHRGRPRIKWMDNIRRDMKTYDLSMTLVCLLPRRVLSLLPVCMLLLETLRVYGAREPNHSDRNFWQLNMVTDEVRLGVLGKTAGKTENNSLDIV